MRQLSGVFHIIMRDKVPDIPCVDAPVTARRETTREPFQLCAAPVEGKRNEIQQPHFADGGFTVCLGGQKHAKGLVLIEQFLPIGAVCLSG